MSDHVPSPGADGGETPPPERMNSGELRRLVARRPEWLRPEEPWLDGEQITAVMLHPNATAEIVRHAMAAAERTIVAGPMTKRRVFLDTIACTTPLQMRERRDEAVRRAQADAAAGDGDDDAAERRRRAAHDSNAERHSGAMRVRDVEAEGLDRSEPSQ